MTAIPNNSPTKAMPNNQSDMRLDDATVTTAIATYPAEVQEPIRWLAGYVRECCSGKTNILLNRVKQLGFADKSKNYFYVIFTGKYFRMVEGKMQGSVANLLQIIDALRQDAERNDRAGRISFIETSTYHSIKNLFDLRRAPGAICKFAIVIGPTGAQKTGCADHYCEMENAKRFNSCVRIEVPEKPTMGDLLTKLSVRYGHGATPRESQKKLNIASSVNERSFIIFDNCQRLYVKGAKGFQPTFSYIQTLQEETGCSIGMLFAKDRANFFTTGDDVEFFEQFVGRAGGVEEFLHLDECAPRADIIDIAKAYGVTGNLDAKHSSEIEYLEALSRRPGRVRILFHALQTARQLNEGKPLTIDMIKEARGDK